MIKYPFSMSNESLTIFIDGLPYTFHAGTVQYRTLSETILKQDWDSIPALISPNGALQKYLGEGFTVCEGGTISYQGVPVPSALNNRISEMAKAGTDPGHLIKFYERLHKNPSFRSREQVFAFLSHMNIAIEPDGTFLAYKGINENYMDKHTNTIDNTPGTVHQMARNLVSDDPDEACHFGFHVGALGYAANFGPVVVICRVDPEHVVCVPNDHSAQKMRVCKYEVVGEWSGEILSADDVEGVEDDWQEDVDCDLDGCEDCDPNPYQTYHGDSEDEVLIITLTGVDEEELTPDGYTFAENTPEPAPEPTPEVKIKKVAAPKLDTLNTKELMLKSIEELRKYAANRLKIVGASKIPGGKSALVATIMKIRKRLR